MDSHSEDIAPPDRTPCEGSNSDPKSARSSRKWTRASLEGKHVHITERDVRVSICKRDGQYLARGRYQGRQFTKTIGRDPEKAGHALRRLMLEIDDGTLVLGREASLRAVKTGQRPSHTPRSLTSVFIEDRTRLRGRKTAGNYRCRLMHFLNFAESTDKKGRYRLAAHIDRKFVVEFKAYLNSCTVTANGRTAGASRRMSRSMVRLCLETLRSMLNWGMHSANAQLPRDFQQPVTDDILGPRPMKDPLRRCPLSLEDRVRIVGFMDEWQLITLSGLLYVPTRFEDVAGATIGDVNFDNGTWALGDRFSGNDFEKGKTNTHWPLPEIALRVMRLAANGRPEGPIFLSRKARCAGKRKRLPQFANRAEIEDRIQGALATAKAAEIETANGRKSVVRKFLRQAGSVTCDQISAELRQLFNMAGIDRSVKPYNVRHAATTDLMTAGVDKDVRDYLTQHALTSTTMTYATLAGALRQDTPRYFEFIDDLLSAIDRRGQELDLW